jgi:hypothetical protein
MVVLVSGTGVVAVVEELPSPELEHPANRTAAPATRAMRAVGQSGRGIQ